MQTYRTDGTSNTVVNRYHMTTKVMDVKNTCDNNAEYGVISGDTEPTPYEVDRIQYQNIEESETAGGEGEAVEDHDEMIGCGGCRGYPMDRATDGSDQGEGQLGQEAPPRTDSTRVVYHGVTRRKRRRCTNKVGKKIWSDTDRPQRIIEEDGHQLQPHGDRYTDHRDSDYQQRQTDGMWHQRCTGSGTLKYSLVKIITRVIIHVIGSK